MSSCGLPQLDSHPPLISSDFLGLMSSATAWHLAFLWGGIVALCVGLFLLAGTRWGQRNVLTKAIILSVFAHLLLVGFATTIQLVNSDALPPRIASSNAPPAIRVRFSDAPVLQVTDSEGSGAVRASQAEPKPWDAVASQWTADLPVSEEMPRMEASPPVAVSPPTPDELLWRADRVPTANSPPPMPVPSMPRPSELAAPALSPRIAPMEPALNEIALSEQMQPAPAAPSGAVTPFDTATRPPVSPSMSHLQDPSLVGMRQFRAERLPPRLPAQPMTAQRATGPPSSIRPASLSNSVPAPSHVVHKMYAMRLAPDRMEQAAERGATSETQQAVDAALAWLARNQAGDGRWDADFFGAGKEEYVSGRNRTQAGRDADTGMTGLALLAFLASGHTHQPLDGQLDAPYQEHIMRGLAFLCSIQGEDGSLAGGASHYARMYCHAMATIAVCEAYNMTGDPLLREPMRKAVQHTVNMQNRSTGGWRYAVGDDGDTSQLGWQLLVVKSAEAGGLNIPSQVFSNARLFLEQNTQGRYGGLATYRHGYPISRTMTAEAMLCRVLLGDSPYSPAADEAVQYLLEEPPGESETNLYYWYYATLALQYRQDDAWRRWNAALQKTLLAKQEMQGADAGSWSPDTVWGGYGGRVYSTAMATLCLESYYRFAPPENTQVVDRRAIAIPAVQRR